MRISRLSDLYRHESGYRESFPITKPQKEYFEKKYRNQSGLLSAINSVCVTFEKSIDFRGFICDISLATAREYAISNTDSLP